MEAANQKSKMPKVKAEPAGGDVYDKAYSCSAVEGRLLNRIESVDVGQRLKVQPIHTDVLKRYIDFKKIQ